MNSQTTQKRAQAIDLPGGHRLAINVSTASFGLVLMLTLVAVGSVGLEFLLRAWSHWHEVADVFSGPRVQRLGREYAAFEVQHLHPQYFSFFPFDPRERVGISNATCSIDADGFRGPGPAHANGRRLAFLLGASTAFGFLASSDQTTITGYLNRLQDEYFFVNAGVPGWTSTQEMFRVAYQIVDYHPALVMTLDGVNDATLLNDYSRTPFNYPPGIPGNFNGFETRVEERESPSPRRVLASIVGRLLPELRRRVAGGLQWAHSYDDTAASAPPPESVLRSGVGRYLSNLARMNDLLTAQGARFIATFQPAAQLHRHLEQGASSLAGFAAIDRFHRAAIAQRPYQFEFHDLASVFDQYFATIPVMNADLTDDTVFVDQAHLFDPGNETLARHLATLIR